MPFCLVPQMCVNPRKSNVLWLAFVTLGPAFGGEPPELDQGRLVWMEFERKLRKTLSQIVQKLLRLPLVLESDDCVVRITNDNHVAGSVAFPPCLSP